MRQSHQEEPYETTRYGDYPGSCFVAVTARAMAWASGSDTASRRDGNEQWRSLKTVSLEKEDINAKNTWTTHFDVAGTAVHSREDDLGQDHEDPDPV